MYRIIRFYQTGRIRRRVMAVGLTLEEAQAHCKDPATSGYTRSGIRFFDGYDK